MKYKGGCVCGAIRYELIEEPLFIQVCHCTHCQTSSGSAFNTTMVSEAYNLRLLKGEPKAYDTFKGGGGESYDFNVCGDCGVGLWGNVHGQSNGLVYVRGGTLDETKELEPAAHIYTKSKQNWVSIPEGVPQFNEGYDNMEDLWPKESIARVQALFGS
jgi:hypothetical protein